MEAQLNPWYTIQALGWLFYRLGLVGFLAAITEALGAEGTVLSWLLIFGFVGSLLLAVSEIRSRHIKYDYMRELAEKLNRRYG